MASGTAKVKASEGLNVRSGAGTSYSKLGCLTYGTTVNYTADNNGWLQIKYNNKTGYICKQYTSVTSSSTSASTSDNSSSAGSVKVTCDCLNIRSGAGTSYKVLGTLSKGKVVSYSASSGGWYKITYNGQTGWICGTYTSKVNGSSNSGGSTGGSTTTTTNKTVYVNCDCLNVRSGAGTGNKAIGQVYSGTALTVTGSSNGWYKIKYGSGTGWVKASYTTDKKPATGGGSGSGKIAGDQKLADTSRQVAKEMGTTGWCAKGVHRAISRRYGIEIYGNGNQTDDSLKANGNFKQLNYSLGEALKIPGIIMTWEKTSTAAGSKYGHTAITMGNGKDSACDFYEYNTNTKSSGRTGFKCFIHKNYA